MRFTFSSGAFPTYSIYDVFEIGSAACADGMELLLTPGLLSEQTDMFHRLEAQHRLPVTSIHSVLRLRKTDPEQAAEDIVASSKFAATFRHCEALIVHLPLPTSRGDGAVNHWTEQVTLSIENPDPSTPIQDSGFSTQLYWRWKAITSEFDMMSTYDTCHAASVGWDLLEWAAEPFHRTNNIHLSDAGGRRWRSSILHGLLHDHRPPGTGELDIERFLARLAQTNYNGLITLEISPLRIPWYWQPSAIQALTDMIVYCKRATGIVRDLYPKNQDRRRLRRPRSQIDR